MATDVYKEISKHVEENKYKDGDVKLSAEQIVFVSKLIDMIPWTLQDAEAVLELKKILK